MFRMRILRTVTWLIGVCGALLAGAVFLADSTSPERASFHSDGKAVERAALEVSRALYRDDAAAARKALDSLEKLCRRLNPEEEETFGSEIVSTDRAYHLALDRTRELAGKGQAEQAFEQFFWVQRTCRACHGFARDRGMLPAKGPLW